MKHFEEFYACPSCGRAISGEKKKIFYLSKMRQSLMREKRAAEFY